MQKIKVSKLLILSCLPYITAGGEAQEFSKNALMNKLNVFEKIFHREQ